MAMKVRSEHDLPTIRVVGHAGGTEVAFQAVRGTETPQDVARCAAREIGIPDVPPEGWGPDRSFRLPPAVLDLLGSAVGAMGHASSPPESAVWLELPGPRGYLYLLPWERLLEPLGRPVLRLPNHTLRPQAPAASLEIALCASSPVAKSMFDVGDTLDRLARMWVEHAGHEVRVHVFVDQPAYAGLRDRLAGLPVVVHDPADTAAYALPPRRAYLGDATSVTNPWLHWIQAALQGRALDVVHFVTHGFVSGDRGTIALASTPMVNTDRTLSRFVGAAEMSTFLAGTGAWGFVLSGPPDNFSGAGLRELADAIALVRPGVALAHDLDGDGDLAQLSGTVGMVFGGGAAVGTPSPAVTCWVHPRFVGYPTGAQDSLLITPDGLSSLVTGAMRTILTEESTPAWVAAGARVLEAQQVDWLQPNASDEVDQDAVAALRSVSALLEKHAGVHAQSRPRTVR